MFAAGHSFSLSAIRSSYHYLIIIPSYQAAASLYLHLLKLLTLSPLPSPTIPHFSNTLEFSIALFPRNKAGAMNRRDSNDSTSDYAGSLAPSEFTSINTNRLIHSYDGGRRYEGLLQGRYGLPNDDTEQARECLKHRLYSDYLLEGKLFISPVGNYPQKIVDLGTGAGFWPIEVAEAFPSARVIGSDITPIQPPWSPPNAEFRVEDLDDDRQPWTRIYVNADLIHLRSVIQTVRHPRTLIARAFENLKPGGWLELHEIVPPVTSEDGTADGHPLQRLYDLVAGPFARTYGWDVYFPNRIPDVLRELGFINVSEKHSHVPLGRWHHEPRMREMGMFNQNIVMDWVTAILVKHEDMELSEDQANMLIQEIVDAVNNPRIHAAIDCGIYWAQKP